jgi:caffeoyl-CoA O-methyltransferase
MLRLVSDEIEEYAERHTTPLPRLLMDLQKATHERMGRHAQMLSGQVEGMLLQMLARAVGARRILEFGTFAGLSAQMMAAALPEDGELITCEIDPQTAAFAQGWIDRGPHARKIKIRLGPGAETLKTLEGPFDLVFIDADKPSYPAYYEGSLKLLAPNGFIVIDNVLRRGRVVNPESEADRVTADLNDTIQADPRVINVLLPVRDGVMLVRHAP